MLDVLAVVSERLAIWRTMLPLPLDEFGLVPFDNTDEFKTFTKAFKLMLSTAVKSLPPLRFNILCLDDVCRCIDYADASSDTSSSIVLLTTLGHDADSGTLSSILTRGLGHIRNVMLAFESFEHLYSVRDLVKQLCRRVRVTIVTELARVNEDLELLIVLSRKLGANLLVLLREGDVQRLNEIGLTIDTTCVSRWIFYDVSRLGGPSSRNIEVYVALPNYNNIVVAITRSGIYLVRGKSLALLDVDSIARILDDEGSNVDVSTVLSRIEPDVVLKVGDGYITWKDVELLKAIDRAKSIRAVTKILGVSYVSIKRRLEELENYIGVKLVVSKRGGADRGFTELTPIGRKVVEYLENMLRVGLEAVRSRLTVIDSSTCRPLDFP